MKSNGDKVHKIKTSKKHLTISKPDSKQKKNTEAQKLKTVKFKFCGKTT